MSKKYEALKLALEALVNPWKAGPHGVANAITAIREALADHIGDANKMVEQPAQQQEPELEPDAWDRCEGVDRQCRSWCGSRRCVSHWKDPLYTSPQPASKPWVGLTDEEIYECERLAAIRHQRHKNSIRGQQITPADDPQWHFAGAIEAKLREKNS